MSFLVVYMSYHIQRSVHSKYTSLPTWSTGVIEHQHTEKRGAKCVVTKGNELTFLTIRATFCPGAETACKFCPQLSILLPWKESMIHFVNPTELRPPINTVCNTQALASCSPQVSEADIWAKVQYLRSRYLANTQKIFEVLLS